MSASSLFAQSGKITGRVSDASGMALPGVNIIIEGTFQGTSTDIDGNYVVIGIRPGTYDVQASFIGYATQRTEGIRVSVDLTTTINFALAEEVLEGQEVVITADAVAIRKDLTSSEARITSETIDQLPVTELSQVLAIQAGVTVRDGALHIRGGRSSEIQYMVDGVPVRDSYDNSQSFEFENAGIEELQVISGAFNAEYGNAMSGVINIVTKEGRGDKWSGSAELFSGTYAVQSDSGGVAYLTGTSTDEFQDPATGILYSDVDPYSYLELNPGHFSNVQVSLQGPILGNKLTFFGLGRYFKNDGWLSTVRLYNIDGTPGDGEIFPANTWEKLSWQGNLRYRLNSSMSLSVSGIGSLTDSRDFDFIRRWSPDGRQAESDDGYNAKAKFRHLLGPTAYYTINVSTFYRREKRALFEDPFDSRYNDFDISPPDSVITGQARFFRGGTNLNRRDRSTRSWLAKFDYETQLGSHHLVKTGVQARVDQLTFEEYNLIPDVDENGVRIEPFEPDVPPQRSSLFNSFDNVKPIGFVAYVQDKIEFESFIVNAGLRFDYFDSRSMTPADPSDPNIFNPLKKTNRYNDLNSDGIIDESEEVPENEITVEEREQYWWNNASSKSQFSPRLGIAYPITEQGVVHFSAGMFFQLPTMRQLFDRFGWKIPITSGSYGPFGNPDINPQQTAKYEIGFKQGFNSFVVDVTAFYSDIRDWVSTSGPILTALPGVSYVVFTNLDYSNTKGITATLRKVMTDNYGFDANYTYQIVEGSNSNPEERFQAVQNNSQVPIALLPLRWDQRHKLAGAVYGGVKGWGSSIRFRFESGFPYTPSFPSASVTGNGVQPEFAQNSRRIQSTSELDLSLNYTLTFGGLHPKIFLDVFNLFDTRNPREVYGDTGEADLTLEEFRQGAADPGFWVRPNFYHEPRRVQVGINLQF